MRGANDGLWDWDLTTNRIYFAPRWKSMLGYAEGQIGDSPEEWFGRVHRMDVERVKAEVEAHLAGRSSHLETECRILHDDGTYRWFLTRGLAVRDADGRAVRIAGSQSDITQRKVVEDRLQHNAFHDSLTGLPNRALLLDRLGQAVARTKRRPDCRFGVLFLDIDGFKFVNDSLGHQMGDQLLIAISRRLESCLRDGDTVARLGGDEFIILMHDVTETRDVLGLAERVLECLQTPFLLDGHELVVTASIGIALSTTNIDSAEEMVRNADIAMYRAKSRGKSGYVVFDEAMHAEAVTRLQLNTDLRQATARGELHLYYQPIVALRTGRIRGFEALLRWYHPDRGLVCPDDFVPLAEETKLILPIGMWVIRTAAEQLQKWQATVLDARPPLDEREHVVPAILSARSGLPDRAHPPGNGARRPLPEDGDHRECDHGTRRDGLVGAHEVESTRGQARPRRLRQGILLAQLPASVPLRHAQDRPLVRRQDRAQWREHGDRANHRLTRQGPGARRGRRRRGDGPPIGPAPETWGASSARAISSHGRSPQAQPPRCSLSRPNWLEQLNFEQPELADAAAALRF